jgi:hypothetical protein
MSTIPSELPETTRPKDDWLFHVTPLANLESIRKEGVRGPSCWANRSALVNYYREVIGDEGHEPLVVAVRLSHLDEATIGPDLPSIDEPITGAIGLSDDDVVEQWGDCDKTWRDCLSIVGSLRYMEAIRPSLLSVYREGEFSSMLASVAEHYAEAPARATDAEARLGKFAEEVLLWKRLSGDPTLNEILPVATAALQREGPQRTTGLLQFAKAALAWNASSGDPTINHLLPIARDAVERAEGAQPEWSERRKLIGDLRDYAERYAEMNGEPAGGDCREVILRAERWFESGSATLDEIALTADLVEYVQRYADVNDEPADGDCGRVLAQAAVVIAKRQEWARRSGIAFHAVEQYDFGNGVTLREMGERWKYSPAGDAWTTAVEVETWSDDGNDARIPPLDITSLTFTVRFNPTDSSLVEAYAMDSDRRIWGQHPSRPRLSAEGHVSGVVVQLAGPQEPGVMASRREALAAADSALRGVGMPTVSEMLEQLHSIGIMSSALGGPTPEKCASIASELLDRAGYERMRFATDPKPAVDPGTPASGM